MDRLKERKYSITQKMYIVDTALDFFEEEELKPVWNNYEDENGVSTTCVEVPSLKIFVNCYNDGMYTIRLNTRSNIVYKGLGKQELLDDLTDLMCSNLFKMAESRLKKR